MFKQTLAAVVERTEGALGAFVMGTDGILVEKFVVEDGRDANLDVAAATLTTLVRSAQRSGEDVGHGQLHELVVGFAGTYFLIRLVTSEYFLVLAMRADGIFGRGRFELRKAELELAKEFAL